MTSTVSWSSTPHPIVQKDSQFVRKANFVGALDYNMYSPQPAGTPRRTPFSRDDPFTSSLSSAEGSVPSFQNFVKRTPPPDSSKPLPPHPLIIRRTSGNSVPRSSSPSWDSRRRASSVYSRAINQWEGDGISWTTADFADEPVPPLPTLHPLPYSASTPQLGDTQNAAGLLQPRMYKPLIVTPSPSESRINLDNPSSAGHDPPSKIMNPIGLPKVIMKRLDTISLDQAKAAIRAPGAVHLLPEELRAQTVKRSQSQQPTHLGSADIFEPSQLPGPPEHPTMIDRQGRHRSIVSQPPNSMGSGDSPYSIAEYVANSPYEKSFKVGTGPERCMIPRYLQELEVLRDESTHDPGLDDSIEQRGRPRRRASKPMQALRQLMNNRDQSESSMNEGIGAQSMARRYSKLLSNPYREASASPGGHGTDSDGSVKAHMRLVPQPLFRSKPPAKLTGAFSGPTRQPSTSPSRLTSGGEGSDSRRRSSGPSTNSLPFPLSLTWGSSHRRRSTSGSIPISPPSFASASPQRPIFDRKQSSPRYRGTPDNRHSAYYPHVASRKQKKAPKTKSKDDSVAPVASLFSSRANAGGFRAPNQPLKSSSLNRTKSFRRQIQSSDAPKHLLIHRVTDGAVGYIDLPPSPIQALATQSHLGWSSKARAAFDGARQSIQSPRRLLGSPSTPQVPKFTHISAPARPLDETRERLQELESPRRKGSLFGGMLDGWKENRVEKRREDLKKIIKIVPGYSGVES